MATTYCVIIDGIADAAKHDRVVAELAFTFKRSHEKTARMLARLPYAVRKGIDFRTAVKYETLLRNCGCLCKIETEPHGATAATPKAVATSAGSVRAAPVKVRPAPPQRNRAAWVDRLAAAGSELRLPEVSWTAGAVVLPLLLAGIYVVWFSGSDEAPQTAASQSFNGTPAPIMNVAAPAQPLAGGSEPDLTTMTRSEFEAAVKGKSEAQVMAAVGPPTLTSENHVNGSRMGLWTYYERTRESDIAAVDKAVFIQLRDGRAESLLY